MTNFKMFCTPDSHSGVRCSISLEIILSTHYRHQTQKQPNKELKDIIQMGSLFLHTAEPLTACEKEPQGAAIA